MSERGDRDRVDAAELARVERRGQVLRLRNAGVTYAKIAEQLGISTDTVARDITKGLREILHEPAEEMLGSQRSMLSDIRRANYVAMLGGDLKAASMILRTMEHEAKLFGLYAPTRVNVDVSDEDFALTAARLMQEMGVTPPEAIAAALEQPVEAEVAGPPTLDAEVVEDVRAVDEETEAGEDEWVR